MQYTGGDASRLRFMDSRVLVSRVIRSCADQLGGGWERDKAQRTAKRYGDDGHGKYVRLRLLLLAAAVMAARALPAQTNRRRMPKERGTGRKHLQLCVVYRYGAPLYAFRRRMPKEKRHGAKTLAALRRVPIRSSIVCFQPVDT